MPENPVTPDPVEPGAGQPPAPPVEPQTFDAEYVQSLRAENAKYRTKAKENTDAAARLAALEEAQKTDEQKRAEEVATLRSRVAEFETRDQIAAWAAEVATETGVPVSALRGSTRDELAAHAEQLKPLLTPHEPPAPPKAQPVPGIGNVPEPRNISLKDRIAAAEQSGDKAQVAALKAMQLASVATT